MGSDAQLVVLSHLRWTFVWQRPQHLISRLARRRRTWFVEEPLASDDVEEPRFRWEENGPVTRVWLEVPRRPREVAPGGGLDAALEELNVSFDDDRAAGYGEEILRLVGKGSAPVAWLYTPTALEIASALSPRLVVYDVMDDLASFNYDWSAKMRRRHLESLAAAGLVFTGGRSLDEGVRRVHPGPTHLFPSGVEPEHFTAARRYRKRSDPPVAGYVGVIDERLDLDLVAGLAESLPEWEIQMVGPTLKVHPDSLPEARNLAYLGFRSYQQLPEVMAGFDVALMPFALNDATRSISPTKTLEYLAAGLPVVSTRVPDVVRDYGEFVRLGDDAAAFAEACRECMASRGDDVDGKVASLLRRQHWDAIAARMEELIEQALERGQAATATGAGGT